MMPWGLGWGHGFGGLGLLFGGLMMVFMFLFWGGLIVLGYFLVRALIRAGRGQAASADAGGPGNAALEILKLRYARGEITKEEYDAMRKNVTSV